MARRFQPGQRLEDLAHGESDFEGDPVGSHGLAAAEPLVGSLIESGEIPSVLRVRARYAHLRGDSDRAVELMETFKSTFLDDWTDEDAAALDRYLDAA